MTRRRPEALDPDAVLRELLAECRDGVRSCFEISREQKYVQTRLEAMETGARLVKTTLQLAAALNKSSAEFTHRIIVERATPPPLPP